MLVETKQSAYKSEFHVKYSTQSTKKAQLMANMLSGTSILDQSNNSHRDNDDCVDNRSERTSKDIVDRLGQGIQDSANSSPEELIFLTPLSSARNGLVFLVFDLFDDNTTFL